MRSNAEYPKLPYKDRLPLDRSHLSLFSSFRLLLFYVVLLLLARIS